MPPPPPRPPPGPPPAPGPAAPQHRPTPVSTDRSAVLQDIQKGARLKKVDRSQIRDRSSPIVANGGGSAPSAADSSANSNSRNNGTNNNGNNGRMDQANGGSAPAPQPMLGGLFAGGMPTLKKTGFRQYEKGAEAEEAVRPAGRTQNAVETGVPSKPKPVPSPAKSFSPPGVPSAPSINGDHHNQNGHNYPAPTPPRGGPPPPKPAKLQLPPPNVRRSSLTDFDNAPPPIISPKPAPSIPKQAFAPGNGHHIINGSATVSAQRPQERKPIPNMSTMPPQKPKHAPPPLPTNPPPTRNISQTMPRPVRQHSRPSLPAEQMMTMKQESPPTPPPLPGRPPSFRSNGDARPRTQPPPPPPPMNPSNSHTNYQSDRGLANNIQQRAPPPTRPPGSGMSQSGSMVSLPDSGHGSLNNSNTMRPPKRHDSLTIVTAPEPPVTTYPTRMNAAKMAPSPPQIPVSKPNSSRDSAMSMMQEFEAKFPFRSINELPRPSAFSGGRKTYPSAKSRATRPTAPAPPVFNGSR